MTLLNSVDNNCDRTMCGSRIHLDVVHHDMDEVYNLII